MVELDDMERGVAVVFAHDPGEEAFAVKVVVDLDYLLSEIRVFIFVV